MNHTPGTTGCSRTDLAAPSSELFPIYPRSWYLFSAVDELRNKPLTKTIMGRELVGFRTASGKIAVLDARCCHQGVDLGLGQVVDEAIQCPFHHWQYGTDG